MADRKKGPPVPPPDGAQAFTVVLEQLRGEFKVFGEALEGQRQQFGEALGELRQQMTDGFERIDRDLGEMKVDLALVKSAVTTHTRELREIRGALGNKVERGEVEAIVERSVARIAGR